MLSVIKWIFISIFIISVLHVLLSYIIAWIELRLASMRGEKSPAFASILKSFIIEFSLTLLVIPTTLLLLLPKRTKRSDKTPILLIHGYLHNSTAWLYFKKKLENANLGPVYTITLFPPFTSIKRLGDQVQRKAESIEKETGCKRLLLVGHSMGGLVSSFYAENLAPEGKVERIVTLASPLHGTRLAALGYGENIEEMGPETAFLSALRYKIAHSNISYCHLASKLDNIIVPWDSALLERNTGKNRVIEDEGHLTILVSNKVIKQTIEWLR